MDEKLARRKRSASFPPAPPKMDEKFARRKRSASFPVSSEKFPSATGELTEENDPDMPSPPSPIRVQSRSFPRKILQKRSFKAGENIARRIQRKKMKLTRQRQKAREIYREALHNTRDTITLVAILIATFTYSAGFNPPGGVHQDGPLIGTSIAARKTAFRVFSVCNNVALFTSLCVVLVLVSIVPFKRKALMKMLAIAHKTIWVAVSFMATAYVAAAAVILRPPPPRKGMDWTSVFLLSVCGGSLGTVFVGLGIMLIKHRVMKREWREQNAVRRARELAREELVEESSSDGSSTISDMAISGELGYHSF